MRIVTINKNQIEKYSIDKEMLLKSRRPCVLIIKLKYKGKRHDFAVPLRSNISPSAPKTQYFPLPPRNTTKDGYRHGVHYIKMFPVNKSTTQKFHSDSPFYSNIKRILDENEKIIVDQCQKYLNDYEKGKRFAFSTDIDLLLSLIDINNS